MICRSIAELHTASAEAALAAFSLVKREYTSVEFMSVYSTFTPGKAASKSLISRLDELCVCGGIDDDLAFLLGAIDDLRVVGGIACGDLRLRADAEEHGADERGDERARRSMESLLYLRP